MRVKNGINLPIAGSPKQKILNVKNTNRYAICGLQDFLGLKPSLKVAIGDKVKKGQPIFINKQNPDVIYPAPTSGTITEINRGNKRRLLSVVIESDNKDTSIKQFNPITKSSTKKNILENILKSGHFTAFKTRPFSKIPNPNSSPEAIFINAMDTNPLAVNPNIVLQKKIPEFKAGVNAIAKLTEGKTFVCHGKDIELNEFDESVETKIFEGCHPAGNVGTHIHFLRPASAKKTVWSINYQDVINIGTLALSGKICFKKFISIGGPVLKNPKIIETSVGANIDELLKDENLENVRIINGSVLSGNDATSKEVNFIGRYATQICILKNETESRVLGWLIPWLDKFSSVFNVHLSSFCRSKLQNMDTGLNGSYRAIISTGNFETLTPLNILPTQLLKAIIVGDTELAQKLGLLELDEEDIALFAYADIGKNDFLGALRECLNKVEKEG